MSAYGDAVRQYDYVEVCPVNFADLLKEGMQLDSAGDLLLNRAVTGRFGSTSVRVVRDLAVGSFRLPTGQIIFPVQ
jgi:hypothetical protein